MVEGEFGEVLGKYIVGLEPEITARLFSHYQKLHQWNKRINLTSVPLGEECIRRHFAESLFLGSLIPNDIESVMDLGSGGGFPGVPIAMWRTQLMVGLVDADIRKCVFLREITAGLRNVEVLCDRAETLSGFWDGVVSRAVKVEEVRKFAVGRVKWVGVLTSRDIAGNFEWDAVTPIPWEPRHVVAELQVSRETPSAA